MSKAAELAALIGSQTALSNRNLIINGAMEVSQRGTTFADLSGLGLDRFQIGSSDDGAVTVSQSDTVPAGQGFKNSMKFDVTTADTSIGAAQFYQFWQRIEGQNMAYLEWGTSDAKSVTLSFWIRSNVTGTYNVYFLNNATDRYHPVNFTIDSADTWEKKIITATGDTTGTWLTTNGIGMYVLWNLALGSNNLTGTNGTWGTAGPGVSGTTQANFLSSTSNELYITGVQLEAGDVATPFEHRSIGDELARCQRYYFRFDEGAVYQRYANAACQSADYAQANMIPPVTMRTTPSVHTTGTAADYAVYEAGAIHALSALPAVNTNGSNGQSINVTCASTGNYSAGNVGEFLSDNDASVFFALSAEL